MHWSLSLAFAGVGLAGAALDRKPTPFLLGPDARVLGHYDAAADDMADALVVVDAVALLPAVFALTPQRQNAQTLMLTTQALTLNFAVNSVVKNAVGRPRPLTYERQGGVYLPRCERRRKDDCRSFYSGHASAAFAAASTNAFLYAEARRQQGWDGPWGTATDVTAWALQYAVAGSTARLRVLAGKHFYSDVVVGMVVGTGIGFFTPKALHGGHLDVIGYNWMAAVGGSVLGFALAPALVGSGLTLSSAPAAVGAPGIMVGRAW